MALFEKVAEQLSALRGDFVVLSKSKPDGTVNKLKLSFVNEKLEEANRLLSGAHKPFATFEQFDPDALPSNSDVQLILSQYLACLEGWRSAHVVKDDVGYSWYWNVPGQRISAKPPSRSSTRDDE